MNCLQRGAMPVRNREVGNEARSMSTFDRLHKPRSPGFKVRERDRDWLQENRGIAEETRRDETRQENGYRTVHAHAPLLTPPSLHLRTHLTILSL